MTVAERQILTSERLDAEPDGWADTLAALRDGRDPATSEPIDPREARRRRERRARTTPVATRETVDAILLEPALAPALAANPWLRPAARSHLRDRLLARWLARPTRPMPDPVVGALVACRRHGCGPTRTQRARIAERVRRGWRAGSGRRGGPADRLWRHLLRPAATLEAHQLRTLLRAAAGGGHQQRAMEVLAHPSLTPADRAELVPDLPDPPAALRRWARAEASEGRPAPPGLVDALRQCPDSAALEIALETRSGAAFRALWRVLADHEPARAAGVLVSAYRASRRALQPADLTPLLKHDRARTRTLAFRTLADLEARG